MKETHSTREKVWLFLTIFFPILIYQFANYSASFIDNMMTGQYDTLDLAGVSMATSLWNPFFSLLTGVVSAIVPIIGHHLGRGNKEQVRKELYQFLYLALILSLILFLIVICGAIPILPHLNLEPAVAVVGQYYLAFMLIGILPLLLFSVFRSFFDSLGLTRLSMYLMLLLVPVNSFFNYVLIYGKFGLPAMGGAGAGLGTSLSYWLVLIVVLFVIKLHPKIKEYNVWKIEKFDWKLFRQGIGLGLPIGLQIFAESAIFSLVGLLMAKYNSQIIASHQAAMNFATLMYAFPVSVSMTMPILVAYEVGAGRPVDARQYNKLGRLLAAAISIFTQIFLFIFRGQIASLYGSDPTFISMTSRFLMYAIFFQLADAYAAPIQGILRGYKDTRMPFIIGVLSYWSVSIPLGLLLDWLTNLGPYSYWIGLIVGIFVCGLFLDVRLRKIVARFDGAHK